jgi:hypothetical protein
MNALTGLVTEAEASLPSGMSVTGSRLRGDLDLRRFTFRQRDLSLPERRTEEAFGGGS